MERKARHTRAFWRVVWRENGTREFEKFALPEEAGRDRQLIVANGDKRVILPLAGEHGDQRCWAGCEVGMQL